LTSQGRVERSIKNNVYKTSTWIGHSSPPREIWNYLDHWNQMLKLTWSWFPWHFIKDGNSTWYNFSNQTYVYIFTRPTYHILVQGRCHEIFINIIKHNNNPFWLLTTTNLHLNKMTQMTQNTQNENMNNISLKHS
jgi:hypothetical protein